MKQGLLLITIVALYTKVTSQAIVGNSYITITEAVTVYGITETGNLDSTKNYKVGIGTKFLVNGFDKGNNIKITFWRYNGKDSSISYVQQDTSGKKIRIAIAKEKNSLKKDEFIKYNDSLAYISSWANYKEFVIVPTVFNSTCKLYYGKKDDFNWGVMTLPLKIRFGNHKDSYFDFEEKLNLGFVGGWRHQLRGRQEQSLNVLAGAGATGVRTDSISLKSKKNLVSTSSTAFSFNAGVLYQYESFQVGLSVGVDFIPGALGRDWQYQGKPWLGIAVGVSLFSKSSTQGGTGNNSNP